MDAHPEIVPAPGAALGRPDPTRRWAVRLPGSAADLHGGLTRPEAAAAAPVLARLGPEAAARALVRVTLPVVLSDGAGPHLADADGLLVLVLGPHRAVTGGWVALGQPGPGRDRMGLVADLGEGGVWCWRACAEVPAADRVAALTALDALGGSAGLADWASRWGTASPRGAG
jgi:hypothetical protein